MKTNEQQLFRPTHTIASKDSEQLRSQWKMEALGIMALIGMAVYFAALSWRKWSDPLIDGYVWYNAWQLSQGAVLYRDVPLVYGPLAACFDATLFKIFGPGMMVLISAHLVFYGVILSLIYLAFRIAWKPLGAFVASAVFISVFSFSQLQQCGNFNFIAPYSHEIVHGTLIILVATFIAARLCRERSSVWALALGLCAGLTVVLKPEFMLASGFLGTGVVLVRWIYKQPFSFKEYFLGFIGLSVPTFAFTTWFAQTRPWKTALMDSSQAWLQVVGTRAHRGSPMHQNAVGLNDPWINGLSELGATASAIIVIGGIWSIGWAFNRPWPLAKRAAAILASAGLIYAMSLRNDWFEVGFCLPGLVAVLFCLIVSQLRRERSTQSKPNQNWIMAFMLVLVAAAMLARMLFQARIYDFGFYQAAFAGMVVASAVVIYIPQWVGKGQGGRRLAMCGCMLLVLLGCFSIATDSRRVRLAQTQPVGLGSDRIFAFHKNFDATGALVNWVIQFMKSTSPEATLLVLPEGALMNYVSRHKHPQSNWIPLDGGSTPEEAEHVVAQLRKSRPDYVVLISRSMGEHGLTQFGAPGTPGEKTLKWIMDNYSAVASQGGNPLAGTGEKGAMILQRKANLNTAVPDWNP